MDGKITLKMFYCRPKIATQLFLFFFFFKKEGKKSEEEGGKEREHNFKTLSLFLIYSPWKKNKWIAQSFICLGKSNTSI